MKKSKIYLDTSVISHLEQQDAPDKMFDTRLLWEEIKQGKYEVYLSDIVLDEIMENKPEKRTLLTFWLADIEYTTISITPEIEAYVEKLLDEGILTQKSKDDCFHIACAVISECDMLLSWNFKHLVRVKTVDGVKTISKRHGYNEIGIYSPSMVVERSGEDE